MKKTAQLLILAITLVALAGCQNSTQKVPADGAKKSSQNTSTHRDTTTNIPPCTDLKPEEIDAVLGEGYIVRDAMQDGKDCLFGQPPQNNSKIIDTSKQTFQVYVTVYDTADYAAAIFKSMVGNYNLNVIPGKINELQTIPQLGDQAYWVHNENSITLNMVNGRTIFMVNIFSQTEDDKTVVDKTTKLLTKLLQRIQ